MFEIMAVNGKFVTDEVPTRKEDELEVLEIKGNTSERAMRCAQMRGFKESVAKKKKREDFFNWLVDLICEVLFGAFIFSFFMGCLFLACI